MKAKNVGNNQAIQSIKATRKEAEVAKNEENQGTEKKEKAFVLKGIASENSKTTSSTPDQRESVKAHLSEQIEWKTMRFYRHEAEGKIYVDIIDKKTGQVIKTIPEIQFIKFAEQMKQNPGLTIDISG